MRQCLKYSSIFIFGLIIGIVIMGYLSMWASKTFLEVFRSDYYFEQIRSAADAHKQGNEYAEFVYRSNVVDSLLSGKLTVFNTMKTTWSLGFPFAALILDRISTAPELEKGRKISYGVELGRLAEVTEKIGQKEDANRLWNESARLMGHNDVTRVRSLVSGLHKIEVDAFAKTPKNRKTVTNAINESAEKQAR
jgi:hypothetical protein